MQEHVHCKIMYQDCPCATLPSPERWCSCIYCIFTVIWSSCSHFNDAIRYIPWITFMCLMHSDFSSENFLAEVSTLSITKVRTICQLLSEEIPIILRLKELHPLVFILSYLLWLVYIYWGSLSILKTSRQTKCFFFFLAFAPSLLLFIQLSHFILRKFRWKTKKKK